MVKKGSSFAKMVVLTLALLMALSLMGVGVSYWSETLTIDATVNTGVFGTVLRCGDSSPQVDCYVDGMELNITVTDAGAGDYYCDFEIENTGDIPVEIQGIDVVPDPPAGGVGVTTTGVVVGTQIDPGETKAGTVNIKLDNAIAGSFGFTVTFEVVPWN